MTNLQLPLETKQVENIIKYFEIFLHHDPYVWEDFESDSGIEEAELHDLVESLKTKCKRHKKIMGTSSYPDRNITTTDYNDFRYYLKCAIKSATEKVDGEIFIDENIFLDYVDEINAGEF